MIVMMMMMQMKRRLIEREMSGVAVSSQTIRDSRKAKHEGDKQRGGDQKKSTK